MKQKISTLTSLYREGDRILKEAGIADATLDAWYLLEFVTGINKAAYFGEPNREISDSEASKYLEYIDMRKSHIPLQHLTGEQEFMGYSFFVNEHVLVPRQDTEILVEEALKKIRPNMRVLDMCTGSGCILLSTLKRAEEVSKVRGLSGVGVDVSKEALEVAEKNRKHLEFSTGSVQWHQSDLFEALDDAEENTFDMILSNPPYIRTDVIQGLAEEVKLHDPYIALDGKEDGLYFYREIIKDARMYLKKGGFLMFEIGYDQASEVSALMENAGYIQISIKKDLAGLDRVVSGRLE